MGVVCCCLCKPHSYNAGLSSSFYEPNSEKARLLGQHPTIDTKAYLLMEEAIARPGEKRARAPSAPPDQLTKHHRTHDIKIVQPQSNSTMAPVPCPGPGPGPGPGLGPDPNPHSEPTPMVSESADLIEIKLNELEAKIFTLIKNMLADNKMKTVVRVAGGWVRDKCLAKDSDDIDIAVDDMNGEQFAQCVADYLAEKGGKSTKVAVIKANPDQSKHLATATFTVFGTSIDCNNLRTEIYHNDSRIPVCTMGTPLEDAERRDFTINSLYYNINTNKVEDLTNKGLKDLNNGIIRTPLPPLKTFVDDPLRVLRAVRFGARFRFKLDPLLIEAAKEARIRADLGSKVTRERFGIELNKVVGGVGSPAGAFQNLILFNLHDVVFKEPPNMTRDPEIKHILPDPGKKLASVGIECMTNLQNFLRKHPVSKDMRMVSLYGAFLSPYHGYQTVFKKKKMGAIRWILRESIKTADQAIAQKADRLVCAAYGLSMLADEAKMHPNSDTNLTKMHHNSDTKLSKMDKMNTSTQGSMDGQALSLRMGELLMDIKHEYPVAFHLAYALRNRQNHPNEQNHSKDINHTPKTVVSGPLPGSAYIGDPWVGGLLDWLVQSSGLIGCWAWKPLVPAKDVMAMVGVKGGAVGEMMRRQVSKRLSQPAISVESMQRFIKDSFQSDPPKFKSKSSKSKSSKAHKSKANKSKAKQSKGGSEQKTGKKGQKKKRN